LHSLFHHGRPGGSSNADERRRRKKKKEDEPKLRARRGPSFNRAMV
jgi:hypothetical protein